MCSIEVINHNELDLSATYNADSGIFIINNFGVWPDEPEFHTVVEMSYADFASLISTINSAWPTEESELNVWHSYADSKFSYYFDHNYAIYCEIIIYDRILTFSEQHLERMIALIDYVVLSTDSCWIA